MPVSGSGDAPYSSCWLGTAVSPGDTCTTSAFTRDAPGIVTTAEFPTVPASSRSLSASVSGDGDPDPGAVIHSSRLPTPGITLRYPGLSYEANVLTLPASLTEQRDRAGASD